MNSCLSNSLEDTISTNYLQSLEHGYTAVTIIITITVASSCRDFSRIFHSNLNYVDKKHLRF